MNVTPEAAALLRNAAREHANALTADIGNAMNRIEMIRLTRLAEEAQALADSCDILLTADLPPAPPAFPTHY